MTMPDVTVRGAGILGLSIAWACVSRGARVQVIDPFGVGSGSSGGVVGALAPHTPENWNPKKAFQLESLLMAETFWDQVEQTGGVSSGYGRTGRIQPVPDARALNLARARETGARTLWPDPAVWSVVQRQDSWAPESPTGYYIHDTLSARLHPKQACLALGTAITARGGTISTEGTDQGQMIWAAGVQGLQRLNEEFGKPVGSAVKGQAAVLRLRHQPEPDAPQIFAGTVHIVPHADGSVAVGSTSERDFDDPTGTDAQLDALIARATAAVPALKGATIDQRWAGLRPRARSRAPMIGPHPLHPNQFIANGGFKIGFGVAPKISQVMADLVLEGIDTVPPDFRPDASL